MVLQLLLLFGTDVRARAVLTLSIFRPIGTVDSDGEESVPGARARVRVRCPIRCTGRLGFQLEFVAGCNVRVNMKLTVSITMRYGQCRCEK